MSSVLPQQVNQSSNVAEALHDTVASLQDKDESLLLKDKITSFTYSFLRYVPVVNMFYDLLFDATPSPESIKELLNLVGLIDALMLSIAIGYLTAVEFDEMVELDERYMGLPEGNSTGYIDAYYGKDTIGGLQFNHERGAPSTEYAIACIKSISLLFASLSLSLIAYTDLVNKDFNGETAAKTEELVASWWRYARIGVFFAVVGSVAGVTICMGFVIYYIAAKFPDYHLEEMGENSAYGMEYNGEISGSTSNLYSQTKSYMHSVFFVVLFSVISLGLGTHSRFKVVEQHHEETIQDLMNDTMTRSQKQWVLFFKITPKTKEYFSVNAEEYVSILVAQRVDFEDRAVISDDHMHKLGIDLIGHRIKILQLFADPSLGAKINQMMKNDEE